MKHSLVASTTLSVLWTLGALGSCSPGTEAGQDVDLSGVKKREPARVLVQPVVQREMVRKLELPNRVESVTEVSILPRASGVVTELAVEEGDSVVRGQALARLDDRQAKIARDDALAALAEAKADLPRLELASQEAESRATSAEQNYDQRTRDHERNLALSKGGPDRPGLISSTELESSKLAKDQAFGDLSTAKLAFQRSKIEEQNGSAAVQRAELTLARSELELSFMSITAPIDGVIASRSIRVGDSVTAGAAAFVITDPDDLRAVFMRPQRELPLFQGARRSSDDGPRNGASSDSGPLEISVSAEAMPGLVFPGHIERISPTIDASSGNFRVTAHVESRAAGAGASERGRLLPGMLVRLEIVTERHPDALVVPKRAVRREGDRNLVFVVRDGRARAVPVSEGFSDDDHLEVLPLTGAVLEPGELVIVVGNRDLEDGDPVRLPDPAPGAPGAQAPSPDGDPTVPVETGTGETGNG